MAVLQMTWQPSLLSQKRKSGPPLGLRNLGNTCYLNSVLQCLTYTPPLANFCLKNQHSSSCDSGGATTDKKRECPFCILEKRIARSLSIDLPLDSPLKINNCLRIFAEHFKYGRQEDAHEFLRYVIDACHNTCLRLKKLQLQRRKGGGNSVSNGNGNTIVKEIFGGALQSQVKCLSCGAESNKVDEMMDISLDILHSGSLKDALQRFFQPEILDGNNKYKCDNCKKLVAARKQMSIRQAPNVLVIQLKRFEGIFGGKIDKPIAFEEVLVLSSYMCKGSQDLHPEYRLCGTIVHSGFSPDSGHYYAYIKDAMGRWYCCNDSYVSLSTLQEVVSEKVYVLFFTRSKQRQSLVKTGSLANGSKCHQSNGNDASKILESGQTEKTVNTTPFSNHDSVMNGASEILKSGQTEKAVNTAPFFNHDSGMNGASKILKSGQTEKAVNTLPFSNHDWGMNGVVTSKANKVHSGPSRKLGIFENFETRKHPANGSTKIVVHKREPFEKTANGTIPSDGENNQKKVQKLTDTNGVSKVRPADASDPGKSQPFNFANGNGNASDPGKSQPFTLANGNGNASDLGKRRAFILANGNGKIHSVKADSLDRYPHEENTMKNNSTTGRTPDQKELPIGDIKCHSDISGLKRKTQDEDTCVLLAKDTQSCTEVEEFKKVIGREASLLLRSCGWSDEVYNFMRSRKKLCVEEAKGDTSNIHEMTRLLIADAKPIFNSKIPESLKGSLVERLILFSQQKQ